MKAVDRRVTSLFSGSGPVSTRGTATDPRSSSSRLTSSAVSVSATSGLVALTSTARVTIAVAEMASRLAPAASIDSQSTVRWMSSTGSPTTTVPMRVRRAWTRYSPNPGTRTVCLSPSTGTASSAFHESTVIDELVEPSPTTPPSAVPSVSSAAITVPTRMPGVSRPGGPSSRPSLRLCRTWAASSSASSWL